MARRPRTTLAIAATLLAGLSLGQAASGADPEAIALPSSDSADISVMTYNVKGLPWPIAGNRSDALHSIGQRLAWMREHGKQPNVVVLQEAFSEDAKEIAELSGYRYHVRGADIFVQEIDHSMDRAWYRGETQGAQLDSGLMILSDLPITDVARAAFPANACAGFDCLAMKGIAMIEVELPGNGKVAIATTHFNSKGASRAPAELTTLAYQHQVEFSAQFLGKAWDGNSPLVFAGDFNRGQRPERIALLDPGLNSIRGETPDEALQEVVRTSRPDLATDPDATWIMTKARDMQFVYPGAHRALTPINVHIPFGTESDGTSLSDHMGFTIEYRVTDLPSA